MFRLSYFSSYREIILTLNITFNVIYPHHKQFKVEGRRGLEQKLRL